MATLTVTTTTNYSGGPAETNIDRILFQTTSATSASFNRFNFGPGLIENNVLVEGDGFINRINVSMSTAGTFSAAAWSFLNWTQGGASGDAITINGAPGNDIITGSSRNDTIAAFGFVTDEDSVSGAGGDDIFEIRVTSLADGSQIDGGSNSAGDRIRIMNGITADLTLAKIIDVEIIDFAIQGGIAIVTADQIEASGLTQVIAAGAAGLIVQGEAIDLSSLTFSSWTAADTVELQGTSETANLFTGSDKADLITGFDKSQDTVNGSAGDDTFLGGDGNDLAIYGDGEFGANEVFDGGADFDTMRYTGTAALNLATAAVSNVEVFEFGNIGGAPAVTLDDGQIGAGGFTVIRGSAADNHLTIVGPGGVVDASVLSFQSWGTGNDRITLVNTSGGSGQLIGSNRADTITGGGLSDSMEGRLGDDTYTVNHGADVVIELAGQGTDRVESTIDYTLAGNVEHLVLGGTGAIDGTGNSLGNEIIGNDSSNALSGLDGADTLNGGSGNDTLAGGTSTDHLTGGPGDDTYVDATTDTVVELPGEGIDTMESSASVSLAALPDVENILLTGTFNRIGTGNALDNVITGNSGNNVLSGDGGNDTIDGGSGIDTIDGGAGADSLTGGFGHDTLIGGTGRDTLGGGSGNDVYVVDSASDVIVELAGPAGGIDTVETDRVRVLSADVENLTLTGSLGAAGTGNNLANVMLGNSGNNVLRGGANSDTLTGGAGDDELRGETGDDSMTGGEGSDRYFVATTGDVVVEDGGTGLTGGNDTVFSQIDYTLGADLEILRLQGTANLTGTGNALDNRVTGTVGANLLRGLDGADRLEGNDGTDTLAGGAGNDTMTGGSQADVFRFSTANAGADTITDFNKNADRFDLGGGSFTSMIIAPDDDVILTHGGGTIRIDDPLHDLSLAEYNALVLPGGGAGAGAAAAGWSGLLVPARLARIQADLAQTSGDWAFA